MLKKSVDLITCGFVKDGVIVALFGGGGNEQGNWAQLGEVVGGAGKAKPLKGHATLRS